MKIQHCLRALLTAIFTIAYANSFADNFTVNGLTYTATSETTVMVISVSDDYLSENEGYIAIPASVEYESTTYDVTKIHMNSFESCTDLKSVYIPASITEIGTDVFLGCSNLEKIVVESDNTVYDSRHNCNAIIETASNTLITGSKNTKIPNNVTTIAARAFKWSGITTITIPSSVTTIGEEAFSRCEDLLSVTFDNCPAAIGESAFEDCGITSLVIPESIVSIDKCAFKDCLNLKTVLFNVKNINASNLNFNTSNGIFYNTSSDLCIVIGKNVSAIPDYFFYLSKVPKKVISLSSTAPICESNAFSAYAKVATLYVPASSNYSTAEVWQDFNTITALNFLISEISLNHSQASLEVGNTLQLTATITPPYATLSDVLLWTSSNPDVALVDADGLVTALSCGQTTITATACDGSNISASCLISVGQIANDIDDIIPSDNYINFSLQGVKWVNGVLYACSTKPSINPSEPNKSNFEPYENSDLTMFDQRDWLAIKYDNDDLVGKTFSGFTANYDGTYLTPTALIAPADDASYTQNTFKVANVFYGNYEHTKGLSEGGYQPFFVKAKVNEVARFVGMINEDLELSDVGETGTYLGHGLKIDANGWALSASDSYRYFDGVLVADDTAANGLKLIMLGESSIWSGLSSICDNYQAETLMIYDVTGRLVKCIKTTDTSTLDVPAGYYIVRSATTAKTVIVR
ncbi:MAG: leucine-rich repeat protein [Muribaculaceae bacterium]